MVMNVKTAQPDPSRTTETTSNVLPDNVTETKSMVMSEAATDAKTAHRVTNQMPVNQDVTELSQLAHALRSMTQLDTTASNAQCTKLLLTTTPSVPQLPAQAHFKFSEPSETAINARIAHKDLNQINLEDNA
jgi:hypothetical protein